MIKGIWWVFIDCNEKYLLASFHGREMVTGCVNHGNYPCVFSSMFLKSTFVKKKPKQTQCICIYLKS